MKCQHWWILEINNKIEIIKTLKVQKLILLSGIKYWFDVAYFGVM